MGVTGTGKTSVGRPLAETTGSEYAEGDEFLARERREDARRHALTDEDRWPWLEALAAWTREREKRGVATVLACSALRRVYRDVLRSGTSTTPSSCT